MVDLTLPSQLTSQFLEVHLFIFCLAISAAVTLLMFKRQSSNLSLPPGPRRFPIIGNLLDMPTSFPAQKFEAMGRELKTDILYLNVTGTNLLVLNSLQATDDLLEKRSGIYSSRPRFVMLNELMGWDRDFVLMPYGNEWKARRRLFQQEFLHSRVNSQHHPHELKANRILLVHLLNDPEGFSEYLRLMAGSLLISVTYGIDVKDKSDRYLKNAEDALDVAAPTLKPGAFLVDSLPWLKHIPSWFPGAGFKLKAKKWRSLRQRVEYEAFDATKRDITKGTFLPSFVSSSLQRTLYDVDQNGHDVQLLEHTDEESIIRETATSMYAAGTDVIYSLLLSFIFAMVCYPDYQAKAQREIERVIGDRRLPDLSDRNSLPYCEAILKETLRWQPPGPLGVPHHIDVEDEYRGYRIPRNTTVLSNIWAISHDDTVYPNPYTFNPERWLTTLEDGRVVANRDIQDIDVVFGSGRRVCPGRQFALSCAFLNISSILAAFDLQKAIDESTGTVIQPSLEFIDSIHNRPTPFKCSIRPRSEKYRLLVRGARDSGFMTVL